MGKHDLITKDYALYVVHHFASMQTWSKEDILSEIDRKIKEADENVVRCKDCNWFVPKHIRLDDGSTREYTEEEKKLRLGVPGNVGINCGSRCMRHISWLENSVPVWVQENDFCSYGERKE